MRIDINDGVVYVVVTIAIAIAIILLGGLAMQDCKEQRSARLECVKLGHSTADCRELIKP